jgi:hypothetical protein
LTCRRRAGSDRSARRRSDGRRGVPTSWHCGLPGTASSRLRANWTSVGRLSARTRRPVAVQTHQRGPVCSPSAPCGRRGCGSTGIATSTVPRPYGERRGRRVPGSFGKKRRHVGTWRTARGRPGRQPTNRSPGADPPLMPPPPPSPQQVRRWLHRSPEDLAAEQVAFVDRLWIQCPDTRTAQAGDVG